MKFFLTAAAISGALAVMLGAFGAHFLKKIISPEMLESYRTGIQYHFYHTFALALVGVLMLTNPTKHLRRAGNLFIIGIFLFSGVIYVMTISGIKLLGIIPAFGGTAWILGWIFLMMHCLQLSKKNN